MTASATTVTTPSNHSQPIAHVDSEDRRAWIIVSASTTSTDMQALTALGQITVAFCLVVTTSCLATRTFIGLEPTSTLGYDDVFFAGAFGFAVVESAMALQEVAIGFGKTIKDIDDFQLEPAQKVSLVHRAMCFPRLTHCSMTMSRSCSSSLPST